MTALSALLVRDMRLAVRVGGGALIGVLFFLIVVTMVPFAIGPDLALLARIGPAILWLGALLASLLDAARKTHEAGYKKIDAYSPFPIEGLAEEIGFHHDEVPLVVLIGGLVGGASGYLMQWWMSAVDYPLNIGGKPP